jgi:carbonic anhydrase
VRTKGHMECCPFSAQRFSRAANDAASHTSGMGTSMHNEALLGFQPYPSRMSEVHLKKTYMLVLLVPFAAVLLTVSALAQDGGHEQYVSPWRTPWTYEGAAHWSDLDPEYAACGGKEQSPIDIRNTEKTELPALRFESKSTPLGYVINNHHTIRVNYHPGNGNFLLVGDTRYQLTQFHFHHPSEEYVHGKPYEMEVHLMYQSSDGKAAGVTVFVKAGRANSTVQKVWEHMPKAEGQEAVAGVDINPGELLPNDTAYFMYTGSLTAPPCTEGVAWFVLKTPINLSAEQMAAFARLYPNDARPLQPINGRLVKESR